MTDTPAVDWYFDVISPFAYLQWTQLYPVSKKPMCAPCRWSSPAS